MKKKNHHSWGFVFFCALLVAAMLLTLNGCKTDPKPVRSTDDFENAEVIGSGKSELYFSVSFPDGTRKSYIVKTDSLFVGEALSSVGLIDGEKGPFGLYVKTVSGVTLDYDQDGHYWAFYLNGEYAISSADETPVESDVIYEFKAE